MRWTISSVAVRAGTAPPSTPTSANRSVHTTNNARLTAIPARDTMMSPRRNWRYLRGLTGTGLAAPNGGAPIRRSEEHTSELQSHHELVCRLLLEKKKTQKLMKIHLHT